MAGPIRDGNAELTNNNWHVRATDLSKYFSVSQVHLLNDFEAIAYSLTELDRSQIANLGLAPVCDLAIPEFTVGVLGPGTGLGAAALLRREGNLFPLITEAGHVGFAPETALQREVLTVLKRFKYGRLSDERLLSGYGLENIYGALAEIYNKRTLQLSAADIFNNADSDSLALQAVNLFFEILGQVAGNFVLATGAFDGIYIAGGIVQRYPERLKNSAFRSGFENKGRHRGIMERVPTLLIKHKDPGLLGAAVVARSLVNC
jgi:glucokinase